MGKWYTGVSDFRKGQSMQKKPPIFKKLLNPGSVEEELQQMLNMRFGFGTWDELKQMQRKIRADRQKQVYAAAESRQAIVNGIAIILALGVGVAVLLGFLWFLGSVSGKW